jgi:uncharacterized membrane protein HdeD (DUF308 family)
VRGSRRTNEAAVLWWAILIRGVAAVIFGVLAVVWPAITLLALVILFGAYAIVDGVFSLISAVRGVPGESRVWLALTGVLGIVIGVVAFAWPGITELVLLMLIAAWAIVTGVFQIISAVRLRRVIEAEWLFILRGVVAVLFGLVIVARPAAGALAVVWLIGIMALAYGVVLVLVAFQARKMGHHGHRTAHS